MTICIDSVNREYADLHFIDEMCRGNGADAAEEYRQQYPNHRHPDHRVFSLQNSPKITILVETSMTS